MKEDQRIINELEEKIKKTKKMPKEVENKINKRLLENLLIAIGILVFYIFLICGFNYIERNLYIKVLKIITLIIGIISICIFEYSYKKENTKTMWWGIEILVLSIFTMFSIYICKIKVTKYTIYLALFAYVFAIYYIGKNILIYKKKKKEYIKSLSDINEIVKKEEPQKVAVTTRKRK